MRGAGRLITGSVRASARIVGQSPVTAWAVSSGVAISARVTDKSGNRHFINVAPTEPQQLVWLVPQYGIDYTITTSTGLEWQIK